MHLVDLVRERDDDVEVVVAVGTDDSWVHHQMAAIGVSVFDVPSLVHRPHPLRDPQAYRSIARLIRRVQPDIVHCHTTKAGFIGRAAARRCGVPSVLTAHSWQFAEAMSRSRQGIAAFLERAAASITDVIIDVCEYNRDLSLGRRVGRPDQHIVVHNGVPWRPRPTRRPWSTPPVAVVVARMAPPKDQRSVLDALAALDLPVRLRFVGDGPQRSALESHTRDLGISDRVEFAGNLDRDDAYEGADLAILPSAWEGFPLTVLEAMRAGLPVIASDVGGVGEAVADRETGLLVRPGSVDAMRDALERMVVDPEWASELGANGRARLERDFAADKMAAKTWAVLRRARR